MIDEWGSEGAFAIKRPKKSFSHETFQIGESLGYTLKGGGAVVSKFKSKGRDHSP